MKKLVKCGLALVSTALLSLSSPAFASFSQATIVNIQVANVGSGTPYGVLQLAAVSSGPPACATAPSQGMLVDISTEQGRAALNLATAAFLAGKKISLWGTGLCAAPPGLASLELVARIQIVN